MQSKKTVEVLPLADERKPPPLLQVSKYCRFGLEMRAIYVGRLSPRSYIHDYLVISS